MHGNPLSNRSFRKRRLASEQVIKSTAETVDIRTRIDIVTVDRLLRGEIVSRPHHFFIVQQGQRLLVLA